MALLSPTSLRTSIPGPLPDFVCFDWVWKSPTTTTTPSQILLESTLKPVHKCKDSREGVTDIKYSPDSRLMAAATADTWIDIYSVVKGYQRVQRCTGHRCDRQLAVPLCHHCVPQYELPAV